MMHKGNRDTLIRIAERITNGDPVDWEKEKAGHRGLGEQIDRLRLIERVAELPSLSDGGDDRADLAGTVTRGQDSIPPAAAGPGLPFTRWGSLTLLARLGEGAFGEVFRARDEKLQRDVALKLRKAPAGGRDPHKTQILKEARKLARVRHPNVLTVHGADEHQGRVGLWADLLEGQSLEDQLLEQGPMSAHEAALIGVDLCRALSAVHQEGLVHRDVKTANVFREKGGRIVLMDFGSVTEWRQKDQRDRPIPITGTPLFMAPEQLQGEKPRPSADLYSVGVVLYRLVSCRFPFQADRLSALWDKHRNNDALPLRDARSDLPSHFVQVVQRALSPRPEDRFRTAGEMEAALLGVVGARTETRSPGSPLPMLGMAAAILLLLGITVFLLLRPVLFPPLIVDASMFRMGSDGTEQRLTQGDRIRPGDRLFLELESSREVYLYLLNQDRSGETTVLFPIAAADQENPLTAREKHSLPGTSRGKPFYWQVSSPGGIESYLVLASTRPIPTLEEQISGMNQAAFDREVRLSGPVQVDAEVLRSLRGTAGLAFEESDSEPGAPPRLLELYEGIVKGGSSPEGVWVYHLKLENP